MTCKEIVESLCTSAGITLATPTFPNSNKRLPKSVTRYIETAQINREILHWVAELCGCFCIMDGDGNLCLKTYDKSKAYSETYLDGGTFDTKTTPYSDGDSANGGNFTDYSSGDSYDFGGFNDAEQMGIVHFGSNNSVNFDKEMIEVTGIEIITTKNKVFLYGSEGYVLRIQKNPFVQNINCDDIGNTLADMYVGLKLKSFKLDTLSDARVEVGDTCTAINVRGKYEMSIITNLTFSIGNSMSVSCDCESIKENSETRYSEAKTNAELVDSIQTTVDTTLQEQITSSEGMFYDRETIDNKIEEVSLEIPNLQASTVDIGEGAVLESGTFYFVYE